MRSVSIGFREAINSGYIPFFRAKAVFPNGYFTDSKKKSVTLDLVGNIPKEAYSYEYVKEWGYNSDFMEGTVEFQSGTSTQGNFDVGGAVIGALLFTLNNNNHRFDNLDFSGAYLFPRIGVSRKDLKDYLFTEAATGDDDEAHMMATESNDPMAAELGQDSLNGDIEWIEMGTYYFVSHKQSGLSISCETYDQMKFLDEHYILADDHIAFPITAHDLVYRIATNRGIVLGNENFNGYGTILKIAPSSDITERQALSYVAQICGCYAKMKTVGTSDRLFLSWYNLNTATKSKRRFSHSLETNLVTITGVRVHASNNNDDSYLYPENSEDNGNYYTIDISQNPWLVTDDTENDVVSNLKQIAKQIYARVGGMQFLPGTESIFTDPSIEAGDVLKVYGDHTDDYYNFIITNLDLKLGVTETITCDAQPSDQTDLRQTATQTAVNQVQKYMDQKMTSYQTMSNLFARLAKESLGTYKIMETLDDGSAITYYSSVPILSNATADNPAIVWRFSADAVQVCDKYVYGSDDNQWTGVTADGMALVNSLTALGINAEWIRAGALTISDNDGNITLYADTQTGEVRIRAKEFSLEGREIKDIADDAVTDYDKSLDQNKVFNKLTNNGEKQGIYLKDQTVYINAEYIATGIIRGHAKDNDDEVINWWNLDTGEFHLADATTVGKNNKTIQQIADDSATAKVDSQTQRDIFNKLTNNGVVQGITLDSNGNLYINATYINTGIITDKTGNNSWNLTTGEFTVSAGTKVGNSTIASKKDLTDANNNSIKSVVIEYAVNNSDSVEPTSGWTTDKTIWSKGKYIWQRTVTTNGEGKKNVSDASCIGSSNIRSIVDEYYLSSSNTTQRDGTWSTTQPTWSKNHYIWTRSEITWSDGSTTSTDPVLATAINSVSELADSVSSKLEVTQQQISAEVQARRNTSNKNLYLIASADSFDSYFSSYSLSSISVTYGHGSPSISGYGEHTRWYVDLDNGYIYAYYSSMWRTISVGYRIKNALLSITDEEETITISRGNSDGRIPSSSGTTDSVYIDTSSYNGTQRNDVYQYCNDRWIKLNDSSAEFQSRLAVNEDSIIAEVSERKSAPLLAQYLPLAAENIWNLYNIGSRSSDWYFVYSYGSTPSASGQTGVYSGYDLYINYNTGDLYRWNGSSWASYSSSNIAKALRYATGMQDKRIRMYCFNSRNALDNTSASDGTLGIVRTSYKSGDDTKYYYTTYQYNDGGWIQLNTSSEELTSKITVSPDQIRLESSAIVWIAKDHNGNIVTQMTEDGIFTCTQGYIGNLVIGGGALHTPGKSSSMDSTGGIYMDSTSFAFGTLGNSYNSSTDLYDGQGLRMQIINGQCYTRFQSDIYATGGKIAGYTINDGYLKGGSGSNAVGLSSRNGTMWAFWAGADEPSNAPFHVGHNGELHASNAIITGGSIELHGNQYIERYGNIDVYSQINSAGVYSHLIGVSQGSTPKVFMDAYNPNAVAYFYGSISVDGNVQRQSESDFSDRRIKNNIKSIKEKDAKYFIMGLKPSSYCFNGEKETRHGFIAQDVKHTLDEMGTKWGVWGVSKPGSSKFGIKDVQTISYMEIIPDLVSVVQQQERRITELEKQVANNKHL